MFRMVEFHFEYFFNPAALLKTCHLDIFPFHLVVHDDCGALVNFSSAGRFLLLSLEYLLLCSRKRDKGSRFM